jgi:hypothetical protein
MPRPLLPRLHIPNGTNQQTGPQPLSRSATDYRLSPVSDGGSPGTERARAFRRGLDALNCTYDRQKRTEASQRRHADKHRQRQLKEEVPRIVNANTNTNMKNAQVGQVQMRSLGMSARSMRPAGPRPSGPRQSRSPILPSGTSIPGLSGTSIPRPSGTSGVDSAPTTAHDFMPLTTSTLGSADTTKSSWFKRKPRRSAPAQITCPPIISPRSPEDFALSNQTPMQRARVSRGGALEFRVPSPVGL